MRKIIIQIGRKCWNLEIFTNMQGKLEKKNNCGCCYRVNTNTILLVLHCGKASLFAQGHKVNITEHKRANLQILFYAFMSTCTNKTNTVQLHTCTCS